MTALGVGTPGAPARQGLSADQPKSRTRKRVESIVDPDVQSPFDPTWMVISFCTGLTGSMVG